ncbi:unnamed protein product [Tilletia controversa]|uniref:ER-bound oxygenase mpaB/mpaB'/Rubber oxygenase catalytic domain-containing protein n=3 Tax=Tilletia TaxID=13289 RepID=A0A8X7MX76_9BASI|nr:hypothetical protein CF336_g1578 [Tilletia laevis]KAE8203632.1 hypothetical protein CF328_g1549 [Tilletia controversa]KAE8263282.1 hypothetical protein A4X03_0g1802 [Tilletia caries]KAE8206446.1 hypothetical protein CF335_g1891 [Tilletia laevis]KAE8253137.1 hypothetical protein A4X06_0g1670 [Tilletia controversa]
MIDNSFQLSSASAILGAVSLTTALAATCTRAGRSALLNASAAIYVRLFHDPSPPSDVAPNDDKAGCEPISVLGKDDKRPLYLSHSPVARVFKAVFGQSTAEKQSRKGLKGKQASAEVPWVRICDFAAEADPKNWITEDELNSWRRMSDDTADQALVALRQADQLSSTFKPSTPADPIADLFELERQCSEATSTTYNPSSLRDGLQNFLFNINKRPPRGAGAISEAWYEARDARWLAKGRKPDDALSPEEVEEEYREEARVIRAAQQMFYKFVGPILLSLLHFSLAGGFSSPKIMSVLRQTGYLVPYSDVSSRSSSKSDSSSTTPLSPVQRAAMQNKHTADRTWTRLLETTQFVLDVMQDVDSMLPPALHSDAAARACYPQADPQGREDMGSTDDSHSMDTIGTAQRDYLERVGGGRGWQGSVRVRLLHANVRTKILASVRARQASSATMFDSEAGASSSSTTAHANLYDQALNGIPINQQDLLATLASFSSSPLWCMGRMGHHVQPQEREDFVSLWRHVGYYMGCEPELLRRCFGNARKADGFLFNVVGHLFPNISQTVREPAVAAAAAPTGVRAHIAMASKVEEAVGEAETQEQDTLASLAILQACANRPPFFTSLQTHWALARHLLGPSLAGYLGIPHTSPLQQVSVDLSFLATRIPIIFGSSSFPLYPAPLRRRWERQRLRLGRIMMRRLITWLNGSKLATFAGRRVTSGGEGAVEIELKIADGARWARMWRMLMVEMGVVLVGVGVVVCFAGVYLTKLLTQAVSQCI